MSDIIDTLAQDRNALIDAIQDAIDHILANEAAFSDGAPKDQARLAKSVIHRVHQDLQKVLDEVNPIQPTDGIPF